MVVFTAIPRDESPPLMWLVRMALTFSDLIDARRKLLAWRRDYNEERPHSSIGNLTPVEFARTVRVAAGKTETKSST
jgi:transposase InsO family protein